MHRISISSVQNSSFVSNNEKPKGTSFRLFLLAAVLILVAVLVVLVVLIVLIVLIVVLVSVLILIVVLISVLIVIHNKSSVLSFAVFRNDSLPKLSSFILRFKDYAHKKTGCNCSSNTTGGRL